MSDSFSKADDLINRVFGNISSENKRMAAVQSAWRNILLQINNINRQQDIERSNIGSQLADHSSITDYKNNTLFVETDHPTRMQLFYLYKNYILGELKKEYPELEIRNVSFFIEKKKKEKSSNLRDITSEELEKAIEKRTGGYNTDCNVQEKKVPDEVKKLFEGFFR